MTIECTEKEKEAIIKTAESSGIFCIFENTPDIICHCRKETCSKCMEKNIEWKIKEKLEGK